MAQHTDRDAEFSAFLADDSGPLARAAWQVADGDRDAASEVLQSALVKTYVAWPRVGPDGALDHTLGLIGAPGGDSSGTDPVDVDLDAEHVLAEGRNAVRGRRMGWTVAGLATLAVVASIVTPVLIASTVPPAPTPAPVTTPSLTRSPSPTASPLPDLVATPWQVAGFEGVAFGPSRTMTLQLDGGIASGLGGCNAYRASYTTKDGRLRFEDVTQGAVGCPGRVGREEDALLDALERVRGYEAGLNGPVLVDKDGSPAVALIPLTPDATTWRLADLAEAAQPDSGITLTVSGDRLGGDTGCGAYAADLVRNGDAWTVSDAALTSTVRCSSAAKRRTVRYLDLLGGTTTAELDAFSLTLTGPDGELAFTVDR